MTDDGMSRSQLGAWYRNAASQLICLAVPRSVAHCCVAKTSAAQDQIKVEASQTQREAIRGLQMFTHDMMEHHSRIIHSSVKMTEVHAERGVFDGSFELNDIELMD